MKAISEVERLTMERDEARAEVAAMLNTEGYHGPLIYNGTRGQFDAGYRLMEHWRVRAQEAERLGTDPNVEMVVGNHAYRAAMAEADRDHYKKALEEIANDTRLGPGWIAALVRKTLKVEAA